MKRWREKGIALEKKIILKKENITKVSKIGQKESEREIDIKLK